MVGGGWDSLRRKLPKDQMRRNGRKVREDTARCENFPTTGRNTLEVALEEATQSPVLPVPLEWVGRGKLVISLSVEPKHRVGSKDPREL